MRKSLRGKKTLKRRKEESPEIQVRFSSDHDKLDFYRADYLKSGLIHRIPLYPFCLEEAVRTRKTFFHASRSDFLQMILLLEGRVQYTVRKRNFSLAPGQLLMIPLDAEYGFETTGRVHKLVLELKGASLATMTEILGLSRPVLLTLDEPERWIGRFREIRERMHRQEEGEAEELSALLGETYELLSRLAFFPDGEGIAESSAGGSAAESGSHIGAEGVDRDDCEAAECECFDVEPSLSGGDSLFSVAPPHDPPSGAGQGTPGGHLAFDEGNRPDDRILQSVLFFIGIQAAFRHLAVAVAGGGPADPGKSGKPFDSLFLNGFRKGHYTENHIPNDSNPYLFLSFSPCLFLGNTV